MKKQLLKLSFSAFTILLPYLIMAAPIEPIATLEVPAAECRPILDGVADEYNGDAVYSDVYATTIFNPTGYDGNADFTCAFQVAYNPAYLYVLVNVSDDIEHLYVHDGEAWIGNPWEFDNVEFFFQFDTNTVTTAYNETTVQLRVNRGLDSAQSPGNCGADAWGYYMEADAPGGWIIEVAIPWTVALAEGATWEDFDSYLDVAIGFDLAGADSDNSDGDEAVGNRDVQAAWDSDDPDTEDDRTEDLAWNNTSTFGYITLQPSDWNGIGPYRDCSYDLANQLHRNELSVHPNPATNEITFNIEGEVSIEIYNITGSLVMTTNQATVDVSSLNSGMYIARIGGQSVKFAVK